MKQEQFGCRLRIILLCIMTALILVPARAADLSYRVELYGSESSENAFSHEKTRQLRKALNIEVVLAVQIVEAQSANKNIQWVPTKAVILRGREQDLNAYYASKEFSALKENNPLSPMALAIFAGIEVSADGAQYLQRAPMAAILLSPIETNPSQPSITLVLKYDTSFNAAPSPFLESISHIQVLPLSFDDNPMDFMPTRHHEGSLGLIGEIDR